MYIMWSCQGNCNHDNLWTSRGTILSMKYEPWGDPYSQLGKSLPLYIPKLEPSHEGMMTRCCRACFLHGEPTIQSAVPQMQVHLSSEKLRHAPLIHIQWAAAFCWFCGSLFLFLLIHIFSLEPRDVHMPYNSKITSHSWPLTGGF